MCINKNIYIFCNFEVLYRFYLKYLANFVRMFRTETSSEFDKMPQQNTWFKMKNQTKLCNHIQYCKEVLYLFHRWWNLECLYFFVWKDAIAITELMKSNIWFCSHYGWQPNIDDFYIKKFHIHLLDFTDGILLHYFGYHPTYLYLSWKKMVVNKCL